MLVLEAVKGVWRGLVFYKINIFVWMVVLEIFKIEERLIKIGVLDFEKGICMFCGSNLEEVNYFFVYCFMVVEIWYWWMDLWECKGCIFRSLGEWFIYWNLLVIGF